MASRPAGRWLLLACLGLTGCLGETPERARIGTVLPVDTGSGLSLELEQNLRLSPTMIEALGSGIPLHLVYVVRGCQGGDSWVTGDVIELRFAPLRRAYELRQGAAPPRRFARRAALLAALDRVRVALPQDLPAGCRGDVLVALDLTRLPTPLRFPAFLRPADWRLVSPSSPWQIAAD